MQHRELGRPKEPSENTHGLTCPTVGRLLTPQQSEVRPEHGLAGSGTPTRHAGPCRCSPRHCCTPLTPQTPPPPPGIQNLTVGTQRHGGWTSKASVLRAENFLSRPREGQGPQAQWGPEQLPRPEVQHLGENWPGPSAAGPAVRGPGARGPAARSKLLPPLWPTPALPEGRCWSQGGVV